MPCFFEQGPGAVAAGFEVEAEAEAAVTVRPLVCQCIREAKGRWLGWKVGSGAPEIWA